MRYAFGSGLHGWPLFWLVSGFVSLVMVIAMQQTGLSSGPAVSSLIQLSVRCAVPLLFIVFAASSLQVLAPGPFSLWLARNRKFLGLSFAVAMAWQAFFIVWLVVFHTDYYVNEVYILRDAIEGVVGYVFLTAMTVTSFMPVRRRMSPDGWKLLHKVGIYYLWMYAFSVYWWEVFYYDNPDAIDYVFYAAGLLAWGARVAAWAKKRRRRAARSNAGTAGNRVPALFGYAAVGIGVAGALSGLLWYPAADSLLTGYSFTRFPETYLPYWPFEPWLPLLAIGFGTYLLNGRLARQ